MQFGGREGAALLEVVSLILTARLGAETITAGDDTQTGGGGRGRFVVGADGGTDQLTDFQDGADRIEFTSGAASFADLTLSQDGDDVLVAHVRGLIRVENVDVADFEAGDFIFS